MIFDESTKVTNGPATFFMAPTAVLLTYHEHGRG